jgi:invasion protein IalB
MIKACPAFAAALLAGMAAPALAQTPAVTPAQTPSTARPAAANPDEVICRKQGTIGSRLASKRICKTRAQWADAQLQDRQELERVQTQRGMKGE